MPRGRQLGSKNRFYRTDGDWVNYEPLSSDERDELGGAYKSARGNFTRGDARRGNRAGAPPAYPDDDQALVTQHLIKLNPRHKALATALGAGKLSHGIREALDLAAVLMPLWAQDPGEVDDRLLLCFAKRDLKRMVTETRGLVRKISLSEWYEPPLTIEQMEDLAEEQVAKDLAIRKEMLEIKRQAELQGWVTPKAMKPAGDLVDEIKGG